MKWKVERKITLTNHHIVELHNIPHVIFANLEDLTINGYEGTMLPNWETSLTKLKKLSLGVLRKLEHLPPLGDLPLLESLTMGSVPRFKKVGIEFFSFFLVVYFNGSYVLFMRSTNFTFQ